MKAKYKDKLVEIIKLDSGTSFVDYIQKYKRKSVSLFVVDYIFALSQERTIVRYVDKNVDKVKYALEYAGDDNTVYAIICDTKIDFEDLIKWFESEVDIYDSF